MNSTGLKPGTKVVLQPGNALNGVRAKFVKQFRNKLIFRLIEEGPRGFVLGCEVTVDEGDYQIEC